MGPMNEIPTPRTDAQVANNLPHAKSRVKIDFARQLERELLASQGQVTALREALENCLKSAYPHPEENPNMYAAWKAGYAVIHSTPAPAVVPAEEVEKLLSAVQDIAKQRRPGELNEEDCDCADFEVGYDGIVIVARNALEACRAKHPRKEGGV